MKSSQMKLINDHHGVKGLTTVGHKIAFRRQLLDERLRSSMNPRLPHSRQLMYSLLNMTNEMQ